MKRAALLAALWCLLPAVGTAAPSVWLVPAIDKPRPDAAMTPASPMPPLILSAARNEYESLLLLVRSPKAVTLTDIVVAAPPQVLPTLYRAAYYRVETPSSVLGAPGLWPDALIPVRDVYVGERRTALPYRLEANFTQLFWLDLFVQAGAPAGQQRGHISLSFADSAPQRLEFGLNVYDFSLPPTATLKSNFGFDGSFLAQGHGRRFDKPALLALVQRYNRAGLAHRVSLSGGSGLAPRVQTADAKVNVDWTDYAREIAPALTGEPHLTATDVRGTSLFYRRMPALAPQYFKAWHDYFQAADIRTPLYAITFDEPKTDADFRQSDARAAAMAGLRPRLKPLVITDEPERVDLRRYAALCPIIHAVHDVHGPNRRDELAYLQRKYGLELWWYQSCKSHACEDVGGATTRLWPSYMIDSPAIHQRIMPWLTWKYRMDGELYFHTVFAYSKTDPWRTQYLFGGNGDGTLFYPGRPDAIGGRTDIPLESMRLKFIREGYEDYEYLRLAEQAVGRARVDRLLHGVVNTTFDWSQRPQDLLVLRSRLATLIAGTAH